MSVVKLLRGQRPKTQNHQQQQELTEEYSTTDACWIEGVKGEKRDVVDS